MTVADAVAAIFRVPLRSVMTWWRRLLGIEPQLEPLHFAPTGEYAQEIVGETQAQETLERLAGGRPADGASCEVEVSAMLIWEDDNPVASEKLIAEAEGRVEAARAVLDNEMAEYASGRAWPPPTLPSNGWS